MRSFAVAVPVDIDEMTPFSIFEKKLAHFFDQQHFYIFHLTVCALRHCNEQFTLKLV